MVNPEKMCRQHLLGEHVECHMIASSILAGKKLEGYLSGLIYPCGLIRRHDFLAKEMKKRGYQHKSPLKDRQQLAKTICESDTLLSAYVDKEESYKELIRRCKKYRERK